MNPFVRKHFTDISAVISCFDRVVITGTLPEIGYADAMARYLTQQQVRLFDFPRWAEPLRDQLRQHAEQLAADAGPQIEFIRRHKAFRKEERVKAILAERGDHPCAPQKFMRPSPASHIRGVIHPGQDEPQLYSGSESDADVCVV